MATARTPDPAGSGTAPAQANMWQLRCHVADLEHYTEWTADFPTIENYYDQYCRGDHAHDVGIKPRAVVEG